jgi:hypothetical protein
MARKRRQQIRDQLIAERLQKIGDKKLLNLGAERNERKEEGTCSTESCKRK